MTMYIDRQEGDVHVAAQDAGWRARLDLEISHRGEKSVVSNSRQNGPLTIQNPFYPEKEVCHLYLLHPPAGIVGGDRLQCNITVKDNGAALVTTPGATKFYRSNGALAEQHQEFRILPGASLEWLPQETIYFPDANARLNTTVHLEGSAGYIGWEIHCFGLPVCKKDFCNGQAHIRFSLYRDNQPLLLESVKISAEKNAYQAAFMRGQPVMATLIATGGDEELVTTLRENISMSEYTSWGVTLLEDIIVIRYVGKSTNEARELFIKSWKILRPKTLGRPAALPRIWAT